MRKVLLVDISIKGHRLNYIKALNQDCNFICLLPDDENITFTYIKIKSGFDVKRDIISYIRFICEIKNVVKNYDVDIVHFLCGDALYKFFGVGLSSLRTKIVVTFHHMVFTKLKLVSIKRIFKKISRGVVHTRYLEKRIIQYNIKNITHVEYPVFNTLDYFPSIEESKKLFGLPNCKLVLSVIGGTQHYKGLDILLEALNYVNHEFLLFICGPEREFSKEYIIEKSKKYKDNIALQLRYLSDFEYIHAINASDYIMLPYRYEFDGASGPLADSTFFRKQVIASNHGSLGQLVIENELGYTFKTEDVRDLAKIISYALEHTPRWTRKAEKYRQSLSVPYFQKKYREIYSAIGE